MDLWYSLFPDRRIYSFPNRTRGQAYGRDPAYLVTTTIEARCTSHQSWEKVFLDLLAPNMQTL